MDELSDYSSEVIEFKPMLPPERTYKFVDNSTGMTVPSCETIGTGTAAKENAEIQTEIFQTTKCDDNKLAQWLRKILPAVEMQLAQGITPLMENNNVGYSGEDTLNIQVYQKLTVDAIQNSQGLAIWLSVYNSAPILLISTVAPHDEWCEHIDQSMRLFMPKRMNGFVVFNEVKKIPLKACLKTLTTNTFNKDIFAGSTLDGDIYIWKYEHKSAEISDVVELFCCSTTHAMPVALDWASETHLISCHSDGWIVRWKIDNQMVKEYEYVIIAFI